jgi:hypothetical protein
MIRPSRMIRFILPALLLNTTIAVTLSAQSVLDQRFLIPILSYDNWPGAFGSIWHGELTLFNASDNPVNIELQVCPPVISMCVPKAQLPPHRSAKPAVYSATGSEGGFLYISTADLANVTFKFRVRDLSRQSQTWGTEIPLVRLTEFRQLTLSMCRPTLASGSNYAYIRPAPRRAAFTFASTRRMRCHLSTNRTLRSRGLPDTQEDSNREDRRTGSWIPCSPG